MIRNSGQLMSANDDPVRDKIIPGDQDDDIPENHRRKTKALPPPPPPEEEADEEEDIFVSKSHKKAPVWLVTFTDIMAIMLAFFVLMYSMSETAEEDWYDIQRGFSQQTSSFKGLSDVKALTFLEGAQTEISIDRVNLGRALDLGYLENLIEDTRPKHEILQQAHIEKLTDRLTVSFPISQIYEEGTSTISLEGKKALFVLGGALARIKNRIEIVVNDASIDDDGLSGVGAQTQIQSQADNTLSLQRALSLASMLEQVGYDRSMMVRATAPVEYTSLPVDMNIAERLDISRRVGIVIMRDDGAHGFFNPDTM